MFGDWNYINNFSAGLNSEELIAFILKMKQQQHDINLRRTRKKNPSPRCVCKAICSMEEWAEKIGLMALYTVVLPSNCIYIDPKITGSV